MEIYYHIKLFKNGSNVFSMDRQNHIPFRFILNQNGDVKNFQNIANHEENMNIIAIQDFREFK